MSNFSNSSPTNTPIAVFKKHHTYEVSTSLAESQAIAEDYSNAHRYQYRAEVTIAGHPTLSLYDPIYLDGLPNGMSGYWTVLSIKSIFGGTPAYYMMDLIVGTDVIGDSNPKAATNADTRNVQNDLAGQSLDASGSTLSQYKLSPNSSQLSPTYGVTAPTAITAKSSIAVPTVTGASPYAGTSPNIGSVKRTVQWVAKSSGKVLK